MRIPAPHSYALERTESDPSARTADHRTKHASFGGGPRRRMFTTNWYAATPTAAHRAAAKRSCATFPKERGEDGVELSLGRTWRVRLGLARCSGLGNGSDSAARLAGPDAAWMVRGVSSGPPVRAHRFRPASLANALALNKQMPAPCTAGESSSCTGISGRSALRSARLLRTACPSTPRANWCTSTRRGFDDGLVASRALTFRFQEW